MRTSVSVGEARTVAFGRGEGGVQPRQRARSHAQDQLIHVGDEIIDRAIGAADLPRQFAGFQPGQSAGVDAPFRRQDQRLREVFLVFPML